jgi:hypothetical protein
LGGICSGDLGLGLGLPEKVRVRVTARVRGRVTKGRLTRSQSSLGQTIFIPKPYLFLLDKI